jgi:hypothetical protein
MVITAAMGRCRLRAGGSSGGRHPTAVGKRDGIDRIGTSHSSYPAQIRKSEGRQRRTLVAQNVLVRIGTVRPCCW